MVEFLKMYEDKSLWVSGGIFMVIIGGSVLKAPLWFIGMAFGIALLNLTLIYISKAVKERG